MFTFDDNLFSDLHKDAYGFRPRNHEYYTADNERKQALWDQTVDALSRAIDDEREAQRYAEATLNNRIADTMALGAPDEETAIRWILDAEGIDSGCIAVYGTEYICFHLGLAYSMGERFKKIAEKMGYPG